MNDYLITSTAGPKASDGSAPLAELRYRSGAAARIAGIPVSTLRIWERRYRVVAPPQTVSGQRLYSGHDVQRLVLLKRLVGLGHAIGTIASLGLEQLEQLATSRAAAMPVLSPVVAAAPNASSVIVVGASLVQRLDAFRQRDPTLAGRMTLVAAWDDLALADAAIGRQKADLLLVQLTTLHAESADRVLALARRVDARSVVVLYGFAAEWVVQTLRTAGAQARREPMSDQELQALLVPQPAIDQVSMLAAAAATPRRFTPQALANIAALSTTVACECPRHLAELVNQLASFENYSAECVSRSAEDAALHADMHRVAATSRALFESALERVAQAEGFDLSGRYVDAAN